MKGKGKASGGRHCERVSFIMVFFFFFFYVFFFLNIVLTWKFVRVSKDSVLYIYIDNIDERKMK